ncbi:hypothetical protein FRC01_010663 [Tulasnella sp. 417]|nr:hypothetical protein FRC01_010663 [Tulasnella sp. 417]
MFEKRCEILSKELGQDAKTGTTLSQESAALSGTVEQRGYDTGGSLDRDLEGAEEDVVDSGSVVADAVGKLERHGWCWRSGNDVGGPGDSLNVEEFSGLAWLEAGDENRGRDNVDGSGVASVSLSSAS